MKNSIFFLATIIGFAIITCATAQKSGYEITGRIEGAEGITFTLQKTSAGKTIYLDTAKVVDGMFRMTGKSAEYPEMVILVSQDRKRILPFFLENTKILITGRLDSLNNAKISGSKSNDEYGVLQKSLKPFTEKMTILAKEYRSANESIMREMRETRKDFIKNNPGSYITPYILNAAVKDMTPEEIESIINSMDPDVAAMPIMAEIRSGVAAKISVGIGKKAPDFTLNDINGKPVSLSSKIGPKLLLVDFWAGWCGPCRMENPNVLKTYIDFNKNGFDIVGVSLDRTKDEWLKAITDDKLPWTQISDLKYFNSAAAKLYNVTAIPANFLLDENGIIVAVNLRGEALYTKVKEILDIK